MADIAVALRGLDPALVEELQVVFVTTDPAYRHPRGARGVPGAGSTPTCPAVHRADRRPGGDRPGAAVDRRAAGRGGRAAALVVTAAVRNATTRPTWPSTPGNTARDIADDLARGGGGGVRRAAARLLVVALAALASLAVAGSGVGARGRRRGGQRLRRPGHLGEPGPAGGDRPRPAVRRRPRAGQPQRHRGRGARLRGRALPADRPGRRLAQRPQPRDLHQPRPVRPGHAARAGRPPGRAGVGAACPPSRTTSGTTTARTG